MPKITYVDVDGRSRTVDIAEGVSVMEGAVLNGVPGIEAVCGGACSCATCHVYVEPQWLERLPEPAELETAMLEFASGTQSNSRLSCQLRVTTGLDGLIVRTPKSQS
jgi:2Fe-2S ferredoxin